jgi:hypothetical protein
MQTIDAGEASSQTTLARTRIQDEPQVWPAAKALEGSVDSLTSLLAQLEDRLDSVLQPSNEVKGVDIVAAAPGSTLAVHLWEQQSRITELCGRLERLRMRVDL